jgi:hypothetical protein
MFRNSRWATGCSTQAFTNQISQVERREVLGSDRSEPQPNGKQFLAVPRARLSLVSSTRMQLKGGQRIRDAQTQSPSPLSDRLPAVDGPEIIRRSISAARIPDKYGNLWQYHSRSDRHSKVACWVIAFELMQTCELLRHHLASGKVVLGVNHTLRDFQTQRKKDLDLVIAQPASQVPGPPKRTFADMADHFGVVLTEDEQATLAQLPAAPEAPVGSVLAALEAKACMTAHVRALPRLHDELDSSHQTTHGNSERALAVGFVMVNAGETFRSPDMNKFDLSKAPANVNKHRQPADAIRVIEKIGEIRRRSGASGSGFDAIGVMVVDMPNDGSPMKLLDEPDPVFPYSQMVRRVAHEYAATFARL